MKHVICLTAILFFINCEKNFGQAGTPDSSFGVNGNVITTFNANATSFAVSIQPADGKIIVAGTSDGSVNNDFALTRYLPNGKLDETFGGIGKIVNDFSGSADEALAVMVQPDGKIIAAGESKSFNYDFALTRYNSNGTLDNTFGKDGKVTTDFAVSDDIIRAMALQSDGKIIVTGQTSKVGKLATRFALARYNKDGSLDANFGTTGRVATLIGSNGDALSVAIQSDGKILVAGDAFNGTDYDFVIARYNRNGKPDTTFGKAGIVITPVGGFNDIATSIVMQPDGKIIAGGYSSMDGFLDDDFAVVRYLPNGRIDRTFGSNGKVVMAIGESSDYCNAVALQQDGKIVLAGQTINQRRFSDIALLRLNTDGSIDKNFGDGGKTITAIGRRSDNAYAMTLQSDGKIVVAGDTYVTNTRIGFAVVRYNASDAEISKAGNAVAATKNDLNAGNRLMVFPNPATSAINFRFDKLPLAKTVLSIFDINGRLQRHYAINTQHLKVSTSSLPAGNYFYDVMQNEKMLYSGKFTIIAH